ncbi:MAG: GNAT family N-acetyltransferase [Pseudomonadales bacterium]
MKEEALFTPRLLIRAPQEQDETVFLETMALSRELHYPWIFPPLTRGAFGAYLARVRREDHRGFLLIDREKGELLGVVNFNNIVRGSFLSASLGYYATALNPRGGLMAEGLTALCAWAFQRLGLHRLEANIQPGNHHSLALVRRLGFRREGFSPAFLYLDGAWRDHERWALLDPRSTLRSSDS